MRRRLPRIGRDSFCGVVGTMLMAVLGVIAVGKPAAALGIYADPASAVQSMSQSFGWLQSGQTWAYHIYAFLLVFEVIALAITTLIFRENLGEFFGSIGLKVLMGGVFMWFVANAGTWAPAVVRTFQGMGMQLGGTNSPDAFVAATLYSANALYSAGAAAVAMDTSTTNAIPSCTSINGTGTCPISWIMTNAHQHETFALLSQGVAFMMMMSCAVVIVQFMLITIESYIVMGAGVLFIGFAGSRFTMPFSQGYFSYTVNVGVKLMALYIILGVETQLLPTILVGTDIAINSCCIPEGGQVALVAIGAAAWVALQVAIGSALIAAVPGLAGSLLSGQSSVSGSQAVSGAIQGAAAAQQFAGQAIASHQAHGQEHKLRQNENTFNHSASAAGAHGARHDNGAGAHSVSQQSTSQETLGPAQTARESLSSYGEPPDVNRAPGNTQPDPAVLGTINAKGIAHTPSPGVGLNSFSADEIVNMSDYDLMKNESGTRFASLDSTAIAAIASKTDRSEQARIREDIENQRQDSEMQSHLAQGYGLGAAAGAVPREYAPPTAVQIRVANPDKL